MLCVECFPYCLGSLAGIILRYFEVYEFRFSIKRLMASKLVLLKIAERWRALCVVCYKTSQLGSSASDLAKKLKVDQEEQQWIQKRETQVFYGFVLSRANGNQSCLYVSYP